MYEEVLASKAFKKFSGCYGNEFLVLLIRVEFYLSPADTDYLPFLRKVKNHRVNKTLLVNV